MANGYIGSATLLTSVGNDEIIPAPPVSWVNAIYHFYKFVFTNDVACTIKINGGDDIYIAAGQGFKTEKGDITITSFIVKEANVNYTYLGYY